MSRLLRIKQSAELAVKKATKNLYESKRFLIACEKDIDKFKKEQAKK